MKPNNMHFDQEIIKSWYLWFREKLNFYKKIVGDILGYEIRN